MTYDKWKTTEPDEIKDRFDRGEDEREELYAEIEKLRAVNADLLNTAKEMLSAVASRDIPSFVWGSPRAEALRTAIAAAEEPAP